MKALLGIDLGGTKIEGVVLENANSKKEIARIRIPTEADKGYDHIIQQIKHLVQLLENESLQQFDILGIGTPGTFDPSTGIHKNSNTTCLNGKTFLTDLEKVLSKKVKMANDANCFALAETTIGSIARNMPDARMVFGIIMGTGVGGGLVIDGKVWNGSQGIGGEWGHNFLDISGGSCYCGKTGCVERVISGPALEHFYYQNSGKKLALSEIANRAKAEIDNHATLTINRLVSQFGKAVSVLINILDPDAIVVGGGVGNIDAIYIEGPSQIEKHLFNNGLKTRFFKPELGDSAGVFGAAMLGSTFY